MDGNLTTDFKLDFVGIGFPRSGTTWVAKCLSEHPEVDFAVHKETNYFLSGETDFYKGDTKTFLSQMRPRDFREYIGEFKNDGRVRGEFSVYYIYDKKALEKIYKLNKDIKVILLLRNPVDYLSSAYYFVKSSHVGYQLKGDPFKNIINAPVHKLFSIERAKYHKYVRDCMEIFGQNLKIVLYDDIKKDSSTVIAEIFSFVGVSASFKPQVADKKVNYVLSSRNDFLMKAIYKIVTLIRKSSFNHVLYDWINKDTWVLHSYNRIFKKRSGKTFLDSSTRNRLLKHLVEDINKLESLLNIDLGSWKKISEGHKYIKKIILTTHEFMTGPSQELLTYLNNQKKHEVVFIANKYLLKDDARTISRRFENGKEVEKKESLNFKAFPALLVYIKDVIYTFFYGLKQKGTWDIYVGGDGSMSIAGIVLKKLGKVKKLVFYTIDFSDDRFKNKFLNKLYLWVDKVSVKNADEIWVVSPRIIEARRRYYSFSKENLEKHRVVPLGAWTNRIQKVSYEKSLKHTVVFMGHLLEKQGVQLVIKAMPQILNEIPDFRFRVIGKGPYLETLKELAKSLKVFDHMEFLGYVEDHKEVERLISECALAVALYDPKIADFTYYADPGKVKTYLACGVPVLITDVPKIAKDVAKRGAGKIVEYNQEALEKTIGTLLNEGDNIKEMRNNALKLGLEFDWNELFKEALKDIND